MMLWTNQNVGVVNLPCEAFHTHHTFHTELFVMYPRKDIIRQDNMGAGCNILGIGSRE